MPEQEITPTNSIPNCVLYGVLISIRLHSSTGSNENLCVGLLQNGVPRVQNIKEGAAAGLV